MCGIAGFFCPQASFSEAPARYQHILNKMNQTLRHRGPNDEGTMLYPCCGLAHVRLSILDLKNGHQPMHALQSPDSCPVSIIHNGEIYNMKALKKELQEKGCHFHTTSDTEVLLHAYLTYGPDFAKLLNGIFAFAIYDDRSKQLYLYRDHFGVKPLFYAQLNETLIFSSEIKGLFCYPGFHPHIDDNSLRQVFGLGPAKQYGTGVFQDVFEVLPGEYICCSRDGIRRNAYWKLTSHEHTDSPEKTIETTCERLNNAIRQQMLSDISICTFLSGGIDSSLVTAICAENLKQEHKTLSTFSFEFAGNDRYFKSNAFQPSQDQPYVNRMVDYCQTKHHVLTCSNDDMLEHLFDCVKARDLPCMADVESSLLYFCKEVAKKYRVVLTGECADEVFGGYPWFHKKECFDTNCFPWSMDLGIRSLMLRDEVSDTLRLSDYVTSVYEASISETPRLDGENDVEKRRREIAWLNLRWFMATLLDRMDRTSMACGLEARVPFADPELVEYVFNVPWGIKTPDGLVKGLLRNASKGHVPHDVLFRAKCPYPKTYHPDYERRLKELLMEVIHCSSAPLLRYIEPKKVQSWMEQPHDYGRPFYGQLMAGPQLMAYLLQVNYWMVEYHL